MTSPLDSIIEEAAREMCKAERPVVDPDKKEFPMMPTYTKGEKYATGAVFPTVYEWQKRGHLAQAALSVFIKHLREPSEGMIEAVERTYIDLRSANVELETIPLLLRALANHLEGKK